MNQRIFLLQPPPLVGDQAREHAKLEGYLSPTGLMDPIGLGALKAITNDLGHRADILSPQSEAEMVDYAQKMRPTLVGFSMPFCGSLPAIASSTTFRLLREAVGANIPIIAGGNAATMSAEWLLNQIPQLDAICIGEGFITFTDLLTATSTGENWRRVAGLIVRELDGTLRSTGPGQLVTDLDSLRFDRSYLPPDITEISIVTSFGCPFSCSFCSVDANVSHSHEGDKLAMRWRRRSIPVIIEEMSSLMTQFPSLTRFRIVDDEMLARWKEPEVLEFAQQMAPLGITFELTTSATSIVRLKDVWSALYQAGLRVVYFGADSGSRTQIRRYNKPATIEKNLEAIKILVAAEIKTAFGFIPFDPQVTWSELNENWQFLSAAWEARAMPHASSCFNRLEWYGAPRENSPGVLMPMSAAKERYWAALKAAVIQLEDQFVERPPARYRRVLKGKIPDEIRGIAKILTTPDAITAATTLLQEFSTRYPELAIL